MTAGTTIPVRDEDAFDVPAVHAWLQQAAPAAVPPGSPLPMVEQFPGGASNLTYCLHYPDRDLVLRRPPRGHKAASAHDMGREVTVQTRLRPRYPLVPEVLGYCEDHSIIGDGFYVMERIPGTILRSNLPDGMHLTAAQARGLAETIIDAQADLHAIDPAVVDLASLGRGPGYVGRQVSGWSRRYREARTDDVPDAEDVMAWLDARQRPDVAARLVHGDWRFDNLVLDLGGEPRIAGVLDWEMATVGDPLMDLGCSLAYWIQSDDDPDLQLLRRQPTHLPGMPTREEYVARYLARTGFPVDDWPFYEVFGLFRLAVIIQQIWFRYRLGQTTNPAFSAFGVGTNVLVAQARSRMRNPSSPAAAH
ncbi:MAG: phosphotransferase family protein [Actinomycetota bacterium]|nr:phosphotransferase family protein [Actinomycetota bacterium]